jgi:hypothetical protein
LTNAFSDLLTTFFETHVFATDGAWGFRTGSTTLFFALEQISEAWPSKRRVAAESARLEHDGGSLSPEHRVE